MAAPVTATPEEIAEHKKTLLEGLELVFNDTHTREELFRAASFFLSMLEKRMLMRMLRGGVTPVESMEHQIAILGAKAILDTLKGAPLYDPRVLPEQLRHAAAQLIESGVAIPFDNSRTKEKQL